MEPKELRATLGVLGWNNYQLARQLQCNEKLVRKWLGEETPIPRPVGHWLARLAAAHARLPPPAPDVWREQEYYRRPA